MGRRLLVAAGLAAACVALAFAWASPKQGSDQDRVRLVWLAGVCLVPEPELDAPFAVPDGHVPCRAIVYNPAVLHMWPEPLVLFGLLHEYAHIVLGHRSEGRQGEAIRELERQADCLAAKALVSYWPDMAHELSALIARLPSDDNHDPPAERAALVERCIDGGNP